jgi:hypothetical protein
MRNLAVTLLEAGLSTLAVVASSLLFNRRILELRASLGSNSAEVNSALAGVTAALAVLTREMDARFAEQRADLARIEAAWTARVKFLQDNRNTPPS